MKEQDISAFHSFLIEDVFKYGSIEKALIMKEIKGMSLYKIRHNQEGWVYYSRKALSEKFPYMKVGSIDRWMRQLEEAGWLKSRIKNKHKYDNTKSYLPLELIEGVHDKMQDTVAQNEKPLAQNEKPLAQNESTRPSHSPSLTNSSNSPDSLYCAKQQNETFLANKTSSDSQGTNSNIIPLITSNQESKEVGRQSSLLDYSKSVSSEAPHHITPLKSPLSREPEIVTSFDIFWKAYPKKRNKGQAEKAFKKLNPDSELLNHILSKLELFKQSKDWRRQKGKYIPYPATWLNARGWEDEIEAEVEPMDPLEELEPRTVSEARWLDGQRQTRFLLEQDKNKLRRMYEKHS